MQPRTNGHAAPLADEGEELFPAHYPKIELETTIVYEGFTFRATFRDTSLAEAVAALTKRGCAPAAAMPAASAPAAPAANTPPLCPVHKKPMKPSQHKPNGWYCTQKVEEGYCKEHV